MKKFKMKTGLVATIMAILVTVTIITTASGCLVCRDCGPSRAWRGHR